MANNKLYLTESDLTNMIKKSIITLLKESQESDSQKLAIKYTEQVTKCSHEEAKNFVRIELRDKLEALKDVKIAKFTLGATRIMLNGELNNNKTLSMFNTILNFLSSHLNEYNKDLNGLTAQELINKYAQEIQDNLEKQRSALKSLNYKKSDYQIIKINSFEQAQQFSQYTNDDKTNDKNTWCITIDKTRYYNYSKNGVNQIYFCLKNNFKDIEPIKGKNTPLDEYGLSMFCVIVNEMGDLVSCTTRWNYYGGLDGQSMNVKEISELIGANFYEIFKPNTKWRNLIDGIEEKMNSSIPLENIFDTVIYLENNFAHVILSKKHNLVDTNRKFVFENWPDFIGDFQEGNTRIKMNNKYNIINIYGEILSKQWFNDIDIFDDNNIARVINNNNKHNFININGELIGKNWFDEVGDFYDGIAIVNNNNKYNFINENGELISKMWFDLVGDFDDNGSAPVLYQNKYNFININGKLLLKTWLDEIGDFYKGIAIVSSNDLYNIINSSGILKLDEWSDNFNEIARKYKEMLKKDSF